MTAKTASKKTRVRRPAHETKALIIEAARAELLEAGSELELNRIAKRSGLSEGNLYYHFTNRAGLLDAMVRDHYERLDDQFSMIRFEGDTWAERERARIEAMAELYYSDPVARLITSIVRSDPQLVAIQYERQQKLFKVGAINIAEAQDAGEIPAELDPYVLVSMLLAGSETGILTAVMKEPQMPKAQAVEEVSSFLARAVGLREG